MIQQLIKTISQVYTFIVSLVVIAVLLVVTWLCWDYYNDLRLQNRFTAEGQLLSVMVKQVDRHQRTWRDIRGHVAYLTVTYRGNDYPARYANDTTYVHEGDQVHLLYLSAEDAFRQPGQALLFKQTANRSRLIQWTTIRDFRDEHKLLFLCLLLSTASFFLISGFLMTYIHLPFLQELARWLLAVELIIGTAFLTYDTWSYYRYYQQLKSKGQELSVRVLDTYRNDYAQSAKASSYEYEATIQYHQQERLISISEEDYETLKPGNSLRVVYNAAVDDMMSADYSADLSPLILPLFLGIITFITLRSGFTRRQQTS